MQDRPISERESAKLGLALLLMLFIPLICGIVAGAVILILVNPAILAVIATAFVTLFSVFWVINGLDPD